MQTVHLDDIILISRWKGEDGPMPDVLVRDVDAEALAKLKDRARRNGRSLGAELKLVIEQAARQLDMEAALALAQEMTRRLGGRRHTDSSELLREDRLR
jgi:plasmid stability protein